MRGAALAFFLLSCAAAAAAPQLAARGARPAPAAEFPGWLAELDGRSLRPLPLSERERQWLAEFPGRLGRFSDGRREVVLRWVAEPSRAVHPAADCFRGAGYRVEPLPLRREGTGEFWGCFRAAGRGEVLLVSELIRDQDGNSWPDVPAWYWAAAWGKSRGPWWAITCAQPE